MKTSTDTADAIRVGSTGGSACLFCDNERKLKPQCTKQRWMVCNDHFMITCPKCGHEGFWMENMKSGSYFACFSLNCNWRSPTPPNVRVSGAAVSRPLDPLGGYHDTEPMGEKRLSNAV